MTENISKKIIHINSTREGGGVSEILSSFCKDCHHEWEIISASSEYYNYTKALHNYIQGKEYTLSINLEELVQIGERNKNLIEGYDIVILHDPQTLPLSIHKKDNQKLIWRCHIDYQQELPEFYNKCLDKVDIIVAHREFPKLKEYNLIVIKPGIDPNSNKNYKLQKEECDSLLRDMHIETLENKFRIVEVSRFDPWKGQDILIDIFKQINFQDSVLILAGDYASDDPEGIVYAKEIKEKVKDEKRIFILENYRGRHINALQRYASIVVQPSIKEGYGLVVSEALFKGTPVIATNIPAFQDQITDGINGFLFNNTEELKGLLIKCYSNPESLKKLSRPDLVRTLYDEIKDWENLLNNL